MKVLDWEELEGYREGAPLAAAVGVFDGLHLGHMSLVREVLAREGLAKGVVTFKENPKKALRPASFHGDIFTLDQKLDRLAELGVDVCVLIDVSGDFSKLAGRKFLSLLRDRGDLRFLAVGADFRCGYRLDTSAEEIGAYYVSLGVETRLLDPVLWAGHPVSSSRIRKAIMEGRLDDARSMLGRDFELDMRGAVAADGGAAEGSRRLTLVVNRGQIEPPRGEYEGQAGWDGAFRPLRAVYERDAWSLDFPDGVPGTTGPEAPTALRLERLVSRG